MKLTDTDDPPLFCSPTPNIPILQATLCRCRMNPQQLIKSPPQVPVNNIIQVTEDKAINTKPVSCWFRGEGL